MYNIKALANVSVSFYSAEEMKSAAGTWKYSLELLKNKIITRLRKVQPPVRLDSPTVNIKTIEKVLGDVQFFSFTVIWDDTRLETLSLDWFLSASTLSLSWLLWVYLVSKV